MWTTLKKNYPLVAGVISSAPKVFAPLRPINNGTRCFFFFCEEVHANARVLILIDFRGNVPYIYGVVVNTWLRSHNWFFFIKQPFSPYNINPSRYLYEAPVSTHWIYSKQFSVTSIIITMIYRMASHLQGGSG